MTDREAIARFEPYIGNECYRKEFQEACAHAISAIKEREERSKLSPCDVCIYNPPSSLDGKPCTMCPACGADR